MKKIIKKQSGFTLIELMIAISIAGIVAAFALPAYQDYVTRAKMAEVLTAAQSMKEIVYDYNASGHIIERIGGLYDDPDYGGAGLPGPSFSQLLNSSFYDQYEASEYISDAWIEGGIIIMMLSRDNSGGLPADARGAFLSLLPYHEDPTNPSSNIQWKCTTLMLPYKYIPNGCRNNIIDDINSLRPTGNL